MYGEPLASNAFTVDTLPPLNACTAIADTSDIAMSTLSCSGAIFSASASRFSCFSSSSIRVALCSSITGASSRQISSICASISAGVGSACAVLAARLTADRVASVDSTASSTERRARDVPGWRCECGRDTCAVVRRWCDRLA